MTESTEATPNAAPEINAEFYSNQIKKLEQNRDEKIAHIDEEAKQQAESCKARHREEQSIELSDIRDTAKAQKETARLNAKRAIDNWKNAEKAHARKLAKEEREAEKQAEKLAKKNEKPEPSATKADKGAATAPVVDTPAAAPTTGS